MLTIQQCSDGWSSTRRFLKLNYKKGDATECISALLNADFLTDDKEQERNKIISQ